MALDTTERLLESAELLFARNGYAGTSLRMITADAGANIAAVNYHFGNKEGLLTAVLDRVVGELNAERIELLDAAERAAAPSHPSVEAVLTAFLLPDLHAIEELRSRDPLLPRFVSRMYSESSDLMTELMGRQFAEVQQRFYVAFADALPDVPLGEIAWRLNLIVGVVVYLFADVDITGQPPMVGEPEATLRRLLAVTVPMMTAPQAKEETATQR